MKTDKLSTFKINKLDFEQMSENELSHLASDLFVSFSEENNLVQKGFWSKVTSLDNSFVYKLYRYNSSSYISTDNPSIEKIRLDLKSVTDDFDLLSFKRLNSDISIGSDYFKLDGKYFRLISLLEMPSELSPSELDNLGDYCVFFKPITKEKSHSKVKRSRNIHYSSLVTVGPKDVEGELSHTENEEMLSDLIKGVQSMFKVEVFFIVSADSEKELNRKSTKMVRELKVMGARPFIESHSLFGLIESIFAENRPKFTRAKDKNSEYLFNLLPLQNDYLMDKGISFRTNSGRDVHFDLFNSKSTNFNALVSGESGSGKSMLVQKIVKDEFEKGTSVLVLDLGNSFRKLSSYYGAKSFSNSFNPMAFNNPHYLKEFCLSFVDKGELTKKDEGIVFKVISKSLEDKPSLKFKELILEIENELSGFSLYFEEYLRFFNNDELQTSDKQEFVYVDTTIFPDKVKQGLILYLFEFFKNFSTSEKILVIDEAWDILKDNAEYIEECFRTFRKFKASAIAISQSISDFCDNSLGRAIYNNSFYKFIFRQSTSDSKVFDLEDKQRVEQLRSVQNLYSQFYLKTTDNRKTLSYIASQHEYELFTSSRDDNKKIDKFVELNAPYYDFKKSFDRWVDFKYLHGGSIS